MATQVIMPQLGESVIEGTIGRWLVAEGEPVKEYDSLLAVTTDKVDTEIPAPASGTLLKVYVHEGQTVAAGTVLAVIGEPQEAVPETPGTKPGAVMPPPGEPAGPEVAEGAGRQPSATPVAQRMAQEHELDLSQIPGSGPGGRITKEDIEAHLAEPEAPSGTEQQRIAPARAAGSGPQDGGRRSRGFISPAVARLATEFDVDLNQVVGTGQGGRITKKDIMAYVATPVPRESATPSRRAAEELPPWEQPGTGSLFKPTEEVGEGVAGDAELSMAPEVLPQREVARPEPGAGLAAAGAEPGRMPVTGEADLVTLSTMRRSIAKHMIASKQTSAHVTTVMEADLSRVVQARERLRGEFDRQGVKLTYTPIFIQAIVAGLRAVPEANSTFREDALLVHRRIHIGVAVAVPDGLIVPVIRNADEKSLLGLARAVNELAERARAKKLNPDDVQGATFTLTNHGTAGSLFATPIINQPQAGILGVGAIQKRPVVITRGHPVLPDAEDYIAIRPMVYLSFTFDHRILDGAGADGFLAAVKHYLESTSG